MILVTATRGDTNSLGATVVTRDRIVAISFVPVGVAFAALESQPVISDMPTADGSKPPASEDQIVSEGLLQSSGASMEGAAGGSVSLTVNYFTKPTIGYDWGQLHHYNAVDIANACGTPVTAAAEGLVVDLSTDDWDGGYGHMVLMEHPNGMGTRYAHLKTISVHIGDYLEQGAPIGTMGQTGDATGCHLHFEVIGAKNPFARN
jgi:murein DD-endopeptidase MepM/ murein hydrolase activator NlpD